VHKDKSRFRVLVTGRRFGKTTLAIDELIENALQSKFPVWYVAPTYKQAKMIAWDMLLKKLPKELIEYKNEVELEVKMIAGSPICLKGADNEDSLRGVGLSFVVLDEYAMMKPNVWQEIIRPMLTDTKGRALFIGTPKGKNALWELFIKGQRKEDGYSSYSFKTIDNPFIDPKEIEDARKQLNDRYFKQEYEASFEDYTGLIWPEYNERQHLIEPILLPDHWETIAAIDPAMSGTTAVIFCKIDTEGTLYITSEYYEHNKRASEVSDCLRGKSKRWLIDPASKDRNVVQMGKLYSLYDEYADNGIYAQPGENDVDAGINRVAEYFKQGKIKIFNTCKNLIYELERYHWAEERETVSGILKPKPFKSLDHACDALRYIVMSRPGTSRNLEPKPERGSVAEIMAEQELQANNWRKHWK
jgi:PBSX family phage terminase large subunit